MSFLDFAVARCADAPTAWRFAVDHGSALVAGDCRSVLSALPPRCVDAIVTDPPYDLPGGFMGQTWDRSGVAFDPATWRACFRVLRPGGRMLAFGGTRTNHRMVCAIEDAGFVIEDALIWLHGQGFPKHASKLKPAYEPICVAWKPDRQATPLNIDACRIGTGPRDFDRTYNVGMQGGNYGAGISPERTTDHVTTTLGRWPANVVIDEVAAAMLDEQSGDRGNNYRPNRSNNNGGDTRVSGFAMSQMGSTFADAGGASRFYYTAKASSSERSAGLPAGITNRHPTVKPIALMRWLIRLITPNGGLVLDPFVGSGTTGCAAAIERAYFLGIDRTRYWLDAVAVPRIRYWALNAP